MTQKPTIDRIFNAQGNIIKYIPQILLEFKIHGHLHLINTGIDSKEALQNLLPLLGFTKERAYNLGGRANNTTQAKWVIPEVLRNLDYYPPKHYLLPNTEVQYIKAHPQNVLFYINEVPSLLNEGRIFLHPIKLIEQEISKTLEGQVLLTKIKNLGLKIVTGYLDEKHPDKFKNYMKSWQEITQTNNIEEALTKSQSDFLSYTRTWIKEDKEYPVLMTEIIIPGFRTFNDESYLNIPRIAMTPPSIENGYREFLFGNNEQFSNAENEILLQSYLNSQIGADMASGDIYLIDNMRVAHSREAFSEPNKRSVMVAMSGVVLSQYLTSQEIDSLLDSKIVTKSQLTTFNGLPIQLPYVDPQIEAAYVTPSVNTQINENFSMMVYDLKGRDLTEKEISQDIKKQFEKHGILHIRNNKYSKIISEEILYDLGFGVSEQFKWGGTESGRTVRNSKGNGFYTVDKYPAELTLLPHQEIFYQKVMPEKMMFHYRQVSGQGNGGRTLVHSGLILSHILINQGKEGQLFVEKLKHYGQTIITGFLDENHSLKSVNFVRSWQDRFQTDNIQDALIKGKDQTTHFDDCWAEETGEFKEDGTPIYMLMTKITIPLFKLHNGREYMMFPRIAYNQPSIINGLRRFIIGNGEEFSPAELELLLLAFWHTRQGIYQEEGDLLLVNNIQYGHSREPYLETGTRDAAVIMAGEFTVDSLKK